GGGVAGAALGGGGAVGSGGSAAPQPAPQLDRLGNRFALRARETGDASYYARAEAAYHRALRLAPDDLAATIGLGSVALSRHEFRRGLVLGRRAVALSPPTAAGYGVVRAARVALGRSAGGVATVD